MALHLQLTAFGLLLLGYHVFGQYLYGDSIASFSAKQNEYPPWQYHGTSGPEFWCKLSPEYSACCKTSQSPVNINIVATKYPAYRLSYRDYDVMPKSMTLLNNWHTVVLKSEASKTPSISFKPYGRSSSKVYGIDDVHFHWGKVSSHGSEHTLNNARSPMEMHFVHKTPEFTSLFAAAKRPESIAVIAVFFQISKDNNPRLNTLVNSLKQVKYADQSTSITPFKYTDLLPSSNDYFFTYNGSLTTPPCSEDVTWFVLNTKVSISEAQLNEFRQLQERPVVSNPNNAFPMVDNFRPQQNLNGRPIYRSKRSR